MSQQGYLYETHFHTAWSSACARSRGPEYLQRYKRLGYHGIIVTDHFWRGNCAVDRHMSWPRFVEAFMRGYEETKAAAEDVGLDVFFGWEETFDGDDYLVYGLDKEWLLRHPEVRGFTRKEQLEHAHSRGGCVVQAHPFRDRDYIANIHLSPDFADAFEVGNAGNWPENDAQAFRWAQKNNRVMTAGSDIHSARQYEDEELMGVVLERPLRDIRDYADAIRGGRVKSLRVPQERLEGELTLPTKRVYLHGQKPERVRNVAGLFPEDAFPKDGPRG